MSRTKRLRRQLERRFRGRLTGTPADADADAGIAAQADMQWPFFIATSFMVVHIFAKVCSRHRRPSGRDFLPKGQAYFLSNAFSIILPLGFLPMAMLTAVGVAGQILSSPNVAFVFVNLLSMAYGLMLLIPNIYAYVALFVIFPLARQFVFSTFFSYTAGMFGYASFGRISGVASTIAGLVQLTMAKVVDRTERGGAPFPSDMTTSRRWQLVDLGLALVPALLLIQPISALLAQRRAEREEADGAESVYDNATEDVEGRGSLSTPLLPGGGDGSGVNIASTIFRAASHISIASTGNSSTPRFRAQVLQVSSRGGSMGYLRVFSRFAGAAQRELSHQRVSLRGSGMSFQGDGGSSLGAHHGGGGRRRRRRWWRSWRRGSEPPRGVSA